MKTRITEVRAQATCFGINLGIVFIYIYICKTFSDLARKVDLIRESRQNIIVLKIKKYRKILYFYSIDIQIPLKDDFSPQFKKKIAF